MAGESISIPILTPGADTAARGIKKVGDAAAETGAKLDFAAGSLKAFNDSATKAAKADATLVQAAKTHAKALALVDDAYRVLDGKATQTTKLFADQGRQLDDTAKKTVGLAARFAALAGTGAGAPSGMGLVIAAGAALSGQVATLGFGFGGLALAAYGVVKPIEKAAQATGGLQKNLHTLDPQQQAVAKSLLGLEHQYDSFQKSLQPQLLTAFNDAFRIAGHLMHDVQPIAAQTGKALDQVLGSVDQAFQSGTWQQFFRWMASQAAPDVQLLGKNFTDLLQALPPLIQDLNPLGRALLIVSDDAAKAVGNVSRFYDSFQKNVPISNEHTLNFLQELDKWTVNLTNHLGPWARAINNSGSQVQRSLGDTAAAAAKVVPQVQHATQATSDLMRTTITTAGPMDRLGRATSSTSFTITEYGKSADLAVDPTDRLGRATEVTVRHMADTGKEAAYAIQMFTQEAKALNVLAGAQTHALTPLENYIGAQITERNDLKALNDALKQSHDAIGLKTQAERNSFSAAQQYITDTIHQGDAAVAAHKGIDAQISSIENALPRLEAVRGKTATYRQELQDLKGILDKLRAEKLIQEKVNVLGSGSWQLTRSGVGPLGSKPLATGGRVPGSGTGDTFPAMLTPGEAVIPKRLVPAVAPFLGANNVPGFASGGIVPSYSGSVAGLPPWTSRNQQATVTAIGTSIAKAFAAAFTSSAAFGTPGPGGGAPAANAALAQRMMPAWGSGAEWAAWNYVAMRESGWSQFARNPSSGAYGIPQALPPSKMGPAANPPQSNPAAQISWMIGYISGRYGDPIGAAAHERAFNWYDKGGYLPTGLSLSYNGTGRPEMVVPGGGGGGFGNIIVHVHAPVGSNPREIGRTLTEYLKAYQRAGGKVLIG